MPAFASAVRQSAAAAQCAVAESGASVAICFSGRPAHHSASAAPSLPVPPIARSSAAMTAAVVAASSP
eukprot:1105619-Pleurochrysis_carterae.AAC.1